MKRTKERFGKLEGYNKNGISGCKVFDGEDLEYQDRSKLQQLQQKSWIEQQKYEKELKEEQKRNEDKEYAEQTLSINRMRAMLESEHENKRREMNKMTMEYNLKLIEMKKDRERKSKYDESALDTYNINEAESLRTDVYAKLKSEIDSSKNSI